MEHNWQGELFAVKDRLSKLFKTACYTDVSFAVNYGAYERKVFHAHKIMLANASIVFAKMFYGSLPENTDKAIEIEGIHPETFSILLKYIYTDAVDIKSSLDAIELYNAANLYMMCQLENYCMEYIKKSVTASNALNIYEFAKLHDEQTLMEAALRLMREETIAMLDSKDFLSVDISTMTFLLEQDRLQTTEFVLFNALESLAKFQGVIKKTTQDSLENIEIINILPEESRAILLEKFRAAAKNIQYLEMTAEQFAIGPAISELLLSEDSVAVTACLFRRVNVKTMYPKDFVQDIRPSRFLPHVFFDIFSENTFIGRIVVELRSDIVPRSAEMFCEVLADHSQNRHRDFSFYYVHPTFCQGRIRPNVEGRFFMEDENFILKNYVFGTFGFPSNGVGKSACEAFYINFDERVYLNNNCVVIGHVVEGMYVVKTLQAYGTSTGKPIKKIIIKNCGVLRF